MCNDKVVIKLWKFSLKLCVLLANLYWLVENSSDFSNNSFYFFIIIGKFYIHQYYDLFLSLGLAPY